MISIASEATQLLNRVGYDTIAEKWDKARTELNTNEVRILNLTLQNVSCDGSVIDLGCGTGSPIGEYVLALGMRLTGVDQSENMLRIAKGKLPRGEWILSSLEKFIPGGKYSTAIAWDSLFHIPREQHYKIFCRVQEALIPKGKFMLTVGGTEHPAFTGTMFGCPFFFDSNSPRVTVGLLKRAGFKIFYTEFLDVPTKGPDKGRFAIIAES